LHGTFVLDWGLCLHAWITTVQSRTSFALNLFAYRPRWVLTWWSGSSLIVRITDLELPGEHPEQRREQNQVHVVDDVGAAQDADRHL